VQKISTSYTKDDSSACEQDTDSGLVPNDLLSLSCFRYMLSAALIIIIYFKLSQFELIKIEDFRGKRIFYLSLESSLKTFKSCKTHLNRIISVLSAMPTVFKGGIIFSGE
jgi:hypothetical protein